MPSGDLNYSKQHGKYLTKLSINENNMRYVKIWVVIGLGLSKIGWTCIRLPRCVKWHITWQSGFRFVFVLFKLLIISLKKRSLVLQSQWHFELESRYVCIPNFLQYRFKGILWDFFIFTLEQIIVLNKYCT